MSLQDIAYAYSVVGVIVSEDSMQEDMRETSLIIMKMMFDSQRNENYSMLKRERSRCYERL